jgi:hypothetical protein
MIGSNQEKYYMERDIVYTIKLYVTFSGFKS